MSIVPFNHNGLIGNFDLDTLMVKFNDRVVNFSDADKSVKESIRSALMKFRSEIHRFFIRDN